MIKTTWINFLVFLGLLLLIEIAGQAVALARHKQFLFANHDFNARHNLFKPHPYLSVTMNKNVYQEFDNDKEFHTIKTTELGTRWTGADLKDTSKIRVICIGGSTTFCTGVEDEESWLALLQKKLGDRYTVINYGVPAYKTVEAIIQLALYVTELKPDIIVFYMGGNDFYNYYLEDNYPDYYFNGETVMPMALLGSAKYESCFEKFKRQSGFFYLVNSIEQKIHKIKMPVRHTEPDKVVDALYVRNIRSMLALSTSMNAKEYFIGQVLNPFIERKEKPWSIRVKKELILPMMDRMNAMAADVCAADSTCEYLDFKNKLKWQPNHYWDEMHFTREGNELFSDALMQTILSSEKKQ